MAKIAAIKPLGAVPWTNRNVAHNPTRLLTGAEAGKPIGAATTTAILESLALFCLVVVEPLHKRTITGASVTARLLAGVRVIVRRNTMRDTWRRDKRGNLRNTSPTGDFRRQRRQR